jgi:hypothetical protein
MNFSRVFFFMAVLCMLVLLLPLACGDDDDDNDDAATDDDDNDASPGDDDTGDDDTGDDDNDDASPDDDDDTPADDDTTVDDDDTTVDDDTPGDDDDDDDFTNEQQVLINGTFETGDILPWVGDWGGGIVYDAENIVPHAGAYAVWLGGRTDVTEWIGQLVQTPPALGAAQLRYWHKPYKVGAVVEGGLTIRLKDELNINTLATLHTHLLEEYGFNNPWVEVTVDLTADQIAAIAGQKVVVHFELQSYGGGFIANLNSLVDDVEFTLCW